MTTGALVALIAGGLVAVPLAIATRAEPWQSALWFVVVSATIAFAIRVGAKIARRQSVDSVSRGLNVISLLLVLVIGASAIGTGQAWQVWSDLTDDRQRGGQPNVDDAPDIVLLLLDGYPRADTLARLFDVDNQPFLTDLEALGFEVAERSRANYTLTQLTLSSMLHMQHLVDLAGYQPVSSLEVPEEPTVRNLINNNPVFELLGAEGYRTISILPGVERVSIRSADVVHDSGTVSEFECHLLRWTAGGALWEMGAPGFMARQHHARVTDGLSLVEEILTNDEPRGGRFLMAHILSPHKPAVFNRDGTVRLVPSSASFFYDGPTAESATEFRAAFQGQIAHLNDRVHSVLASVVEHNPEAVILVMSDHGSASQFDGSDLNSDLDERFGNLFAARTPGRSGVFTEWETPVNVFPDLLNSYFGLKLPRRSDATWAGVVQFTEVPNPDAAE